MAGFTFQFNFAPGPGVYSERDFLTRRGYSSSLASREISHLPSIDETTETEQEVGHINIDDDIVPAAIVKHLRISRTNTNN